MLRKFILLILNGLVIAMGGQAQTQGTNTTHPPHSWSSILQFSLNEIQTGPLDQIGYPVYNIAETWAAAGFVEQANQLLTAYWSYKLVDPNDFHVAHDGFGVLWTVSGKQPDVIPMKLRGLKEVVQDNWDEFFYPDKWVPEFRAKFENKDWTELDSLLLEAKAIQLAYDAGNPTHRASRENRLQSIQAFTRYFERDHPEGYGWFQSTACAALVAASLGEDSVAGSFIRSWGQGYLQYPNNYMLTKLMGDTATVRLLLSGILASVWGLDKATCDADLKRVKAVLERRVKKGPSLVYGQLTLKELLQHISDQAIKAGELTFDEEVKRSHWLGYPAATTKAISEAERRLGIQLPTSYRELLLLTNGFRASDYVAVSFLPVEKIGWLRDMDPQLIEIWGQPLGPTKADKALAEGFQRSLLIGGDHEESQFLLVPPGKDNKEWQYWYFANSEPEFYPVIRYYLEFSLWLMENQQGRLY